MNDHEAFRREVECVNKHADAWRIVCWIQDKHRKPAAFAFTEGPERQIAYAVEQLLWDMTHPF